MRTYKVHLSKTELLQQIQVFFNGKYLLSIKFGFLSLICLLLMNFINKTKEGINSPTEKMESIHIQEDLKCFFFKKGQELN